MSILICDDNEDLIRALTVLLRKDYNILTARSATECRSTFRNALNQGGEIRLLILDYQLRDAPAQDVAAEVRGKSPKTTILLITGYEFDEPGVSKMFDCGLADYRLKKPFALGDLKKNVSEILTRI